MARVKQPRDWKYLRTYFLGSDTNTHREGIDSDNSGICVRLYVDEANITPTKMDIMYDWEITDEDKAIEWLYSYQAYLEQDLPASLNIALFIDPQDDEVAYGYPFTVANDERSFWLYYPGDVGASGANSPIITLTKPYDSEWWWMPPVWIGIAHDGHSITLTDDFDRSAFNSYTGKITGTESPRKFRDVFQLLRDDSEWKSSVATPVRGLLIGSGSDENIDKWGICYPEPGKVRIWGITPEGSGTSKYNYRNYNFVTGMEAYIGSRSNGKQTQATSGELFYVDLDNTPVSTDPSVAKAFGIVTQAEFNEVDVSHDLYFTQEIAPDAPHMHNYWLNTSKPTKHSTIGFNWMASSEKILGNGTAVPVAGYRIRLYRNGKQLETLNAPLEYDIPDSIFKRTIITGKGTSANSNATEVFISADSRLIEDTNNPENPGADLVNLRGVYVALDTFPEFESGDEVYIDVSAYSFYSPGTKAYSVHEYQYPSEPTGSYSIKAEGTPSAAIRLDTPAIMRVCTDRDHQGARWYTGVPNVNIKGEWHEATGVFVKVAGEWVESQ